MIVSAGIATTAKARALTEEKVARLWDRWKVGESEPTALHEVEGIIYDLSEDMHFAGLHMHIHDLLWRDMFTPLREVWGQGRMVLSEKEIVAKYGRLKELTVDQDWWFVYDLDGTRFDDLAEPVARQVPLDEWEAGQPENLRRPFAAWVRN